MHAPENADAIEGCLMAACKGLDMGIAELWRRENRSGLHFSCLHVTASESTLTNFSSALLGKAAQSRKHQLSPQVGRAVGLSVRFFKGKRGDGSRVVGYLSCNARLTRPPSTTSQSRRQLCEKGMRQKVPLWYTASDPDTPIHPTMPIKTAIVVPTFSYEIQQVRPSAKHTYVHTCLRAVCRHAVVVGPIDGPIHPSIDPPTD